jgi:hypothetical protein
MMIQGMEAALCGVNSKWDMMGHEGVGMSRACLLRQRLAQPVQIGVVVLFAEQAEFAMMSTLLLAYGFARAHCDECGHDFLIAFSCYLELEIIQSLRGGGGSGTHEG